MATMAAAKRDYYAVLEVERTSTRDEIAAAYRKLAIKYHPDKNPGDEEAVARFKEAAEAFEVLNDPEKRARYDRFGQAGLDAAGGQPHFNDLSEIFSAFGDLFGDGMFGEMFTGGRTRQRVRRGGDIRCDLELDLLEAARGCSKKVRFEREIPCATCRGSGAKPGTQPEKCSYCGGRGQVVQASGIFRVQTTCPACRGQGSLVKEPCGDCRGSGLQRSRVALDVSIPAGVDSGNRLRLAGEGHPGPAGGPPGDCYVFLEVRDHPLFRREGRNLVCQLPISYSQAALGAKVEVPTLDGREELTLAAGTQPGDVVKLRGRGLPEPGRRGRGDLLVEILLEVPRKLTSRQEQLLRELAEEEHANVDPHRKSFFEKLRAYFLPAEESHAPDE